LELTHVFVDDLDYLFISEPSLHRVVRYNLKTKARTALVDTYDGKPLEATYHLTVEPSNKYLYFTNPQSGNVYRVRLEEKNSKTQPVVELVTDQVKHPTHVTFSTKQKHRAFVGNCINGEFSVYVFDIGTNEKWRYSKEWNMESIGWTNSTLRENIGCVRGMLSYNGHLLVTCGNRICFINEETGIMEAALKFFDGVTMNDLMMCERKIYVSSNYSLWRFFHQQNTKL